MSTLAHTLRREARVAFSRNAQPVWFRILKWAVGLACAAWFHDQTWFWPLVAAFIVTAFAVHFLYRWKTSGWTRAWGGWKDLDALRD